MRQGCAMNMAIYALCIQTFLRLLDLKLPGIRIGLRTRPTSVVTYADDVIIFVTSAADVASIGETIRLYERASGACLNPRKSKALNREVTSVGKARLHSGPLPGKTDAWSQHFSPVQNLVYRPNLAGPKHIHTTTDNCHYMVYVERNSLPSACINTTTTKTNGRMGEAGYWAKCRALLLYRMHLQGQRNGTLTAAWLQNWTLTGRRTNPPHATRFPTKLAYLYVYAVNMAYIKRPEQDVAPRFFCRFIYASPHSMALALKGARDVGIMTQHPTPRGLRCEGTYTQYSHRRNLKQSGFWLFMISYRPTTD